MKKTGLILLFVLSIVVGTAQEIRPARVKYITEHKDDAVRDMQKTGVPASITLAQALLESQDGQSALAKEANNHFGIKCSDWKGGTYIQDDDKKDECFRKYKSTLESYDDHSNFLKTRPRYASLFELQATDYKGWAHGLKKAGYATDPNYASRLIKIIEENQLYLYDQGTEPVLFADANSSEGSAIESSTKKAAGSIKKVFVPTSEVVDPFGPRKVMTVNGIKCVIATNKDNLESIAKEFEMGSWQLPKYNEMNSYTRLSEGQIVYLQPKKKTGLNSVYTVKPGDSIASIAQANGIKTKYIYKYNKLKEGDVVEAGQQLYLEKPNH
jgi:LysM repeat protein